jgi:hypothetical protein
MTSCDCENTSSKFSRNLCSISSTPSTNGGIAKDNKMRKKIRCIIRIECEKVKIKNTFLD